MSRLYDWLLTKPREELARLLSTEARENARLRERVARLETELFWLRAAERDASQQ